ncbi:hypothetical protein niasHT_032241 [Heterodera trifolii]|uniref:LisH domain-containing protein n=1 Tax=Heterodera trifolii TaxID=157864 RepID=A0ABD2HZG8_9BILA
MSSDSEEIGGVDEHERKAQLVKTINQLLLQNGLPVSAAALRKECETLWRRKDVKSNKNWWTIDKKNAKNGCEKLDKLLASEEMSVIGGGHSSETEDVTTTVTSITTQRPKLTAKSKISGGTSQQLMPPSSTAKSQCASSPKNSLKDLSAAHGTQRAVHGAVPSVTHTDKPRHPSKSTKKKQHSLPAAVPHQSNRQSHSNSDTEEEIGGGTGATKPLRKKADSAHNLSQSPPADPIRARPPAAAVGSAGDQQQQGQLLLAPMDNKMFDADNKKELEMNNNGMENESQRWLCANLNYASVGTALLKGTPNRDSALLVQALRQQITKACSMTAGEANLSKMISNDIFMLRNKKQSVLSLFLLPSQQSSSNFTSVDSRRPNLIPSFSSTSLISGTSSTCAGVGLPPSMPSFVDLLKDQLGRLLNVVTSFRHGRDYLLSVGNGRQFLYEIALALRTKRIRGATVDNLLAALQKMSIRRPVQKELILNGMLEWLCRWLSQPRQSLSALEFGTALLHNLCLCPISHQTIFRHKDELLATVLLLIGQAKSVQLFHCACATLFSLLALPRVRASARERGEAERMLNECVRRTNAAGSSNNAMQLTEQQRQQLTALLHMLKTGGEPAEVTAGNKKRIHLTEDFCEKSEEEEQSFPDYLEAEIDSTDPLVPSLNELFGDDLLVRRFLLQDDGDASHPRMPPNVMSYQRQNNYCPTQFGFIEDDRESIPGVVPVPRAHHKTAVVAAEKLATETRQLKARTTQTQICPLEEHGKLRMAKTNGDKEIAAECHPSLARISTHHERSNSMSSHSTFVVENNARRPLLAANGFSSLVALMRNVGGGRWQRAQQKQKKMADMDKEDFVNLEIEPTAETKLFGDECCTSSTDQCKQREATEEIFVRMAKTTATQPQAGRGGQQRTPESTINPTKMFSSKLTKKADHYKWPRGQTDNGGDQRKKLIRKSSIKNGWKNVKAVPVEDSKSGQQNLEERTKSRSYDEYLHVFAARPKVSRTPPAKHPQNQ